MTNFRLFQTERVCNNNLKFYENGRKFSKRVENTVGGGEVAHYEQFLLYHCVFKRLGPQTRKIQGLFGKGLIESVSPVQCKRFILLALGNLILCSVFVSVITLCTKYIALTQQFRVLKIPRKKGFENFVEDISLSAKQHFLYFQQYFLPFQ